MAFSKMIFVAFFLLMFFSKGILIDGRHLRVQKFQIFVQSQRNTSLNNVDDSTSKAEHTGAQPQTLVAPPPSPGHADDFKPTTPGHSPGIGHRSIHN
ncbi:hypothetical protein LIER_08596 [Lithospermum erythrorhizon]|uniref:Encoded peptide n=1 Tax=Lithospermum erythrorhizon TaxID=34254 RepID=A0AAV3PFG9_LITER